MTTQQMQNETPVKPTLGMSEARDEGYDVDPELSDYRVVNRSVIAGVVILFFALIGLVFPSMLAVAVLGALVSFIGIRTIAKFPKEYSGMSVGVFALVANLAIAIGGAAMHIIEYRTEIKEGYERVSFYELQPPLGFDFPRKALDINEKKIFIKGYMHPSVMQLGKVQEFVLVPDMGTCCFGGQPKMTDMILIKTDEKSATEYRRRQLKLHGKFAFDPSHRRDFDKEVKGVCYEMSVTDVK